MTAPVLAHKKFWIVKPKAGRNYVKNPRFDKPDGVEDWLASGSGVTIVLTGDYARRGAYSLQVNTATGIASSAYYDNVSITSGLDYTFSVDVKGVAGQAMRIVIADSSHAAKATKTFTATGYWQRVEATLTATETSSTYELWVTRDAVASTAVFYVDGAQFEQESKATTFMHGYGAGCKWDGAIRNSDSIRSAYTGLGGELLDLDDYCSVASVTGLGHGDWNQIVTKMTSGGDLYQDHIRKSRQFSIVIDFTGDTLGEIETNRKVLIDALRPDLLDGAKVDEQFGINWGSDVRPHGERIVRYQGFAANGDEATNPIDIRCVPLPATLTDTPDLPTYQRAVLNFGVPSGLLDGAYQEGKELDLYADFPAEYIVKRDPDGNWCKWNGSAYVNPLAGVNGIVYDIKEAPNGDIYVCGSFTGVSNGGSAVANTKGIARWSKASQVWQAVGDPNTGATITYIYTMAFDAAGDLYVGGNFTNLAGIANADYFAKYTVSTNTWSALGSGIAGSRSDVSSIAISPTGVIYIGGGFTEASGNTNCKYIAYWNGSVWAPLATGLNYDVYCLNFQSDGSSGSTMPKYRLLIGGAFTDADGANGDYFCYWSGSSFKSFTDFGATELNGSVQSIDINPNGTIVIGGNFTNAGGDANADYVAAWRGNNWGALMAGGVNSLVNTVYCADNSDIYLGGKFTQSGGLTLTDRVVKSVQGAFQPLDIDLPGTENILAIFIASDGSLYLGGAFSTAGASENAKTGVVALNLNVASASANTYPYIQIAGPGTLKSIVNYSTGANVSFDGLTLLAGEWVSFNFDPVTLKFQGGWNGRGNLLRYVNAGSDYGNFYLKPGANNISLFMDDTDANTSAMIMWTPKFWGLDGALL
jgi:hypothetical protein